MRGAGEWIRKYICLLAVGMLVLDWAGFMWGDTHRDEAFCLTQIGFFILAHALYTKERQ
jgi:hypothetical protein